MSPLVCDDRRSIPPVSVKVSDARGQAPTAMKEARGEQIHDLVGFSTNSITSPIGSGTLTGGTQAMKPSSLVRLPFRHFREE